MAQSLSLCCPRRQLSCCWVVEEGESGGNNCKTLGDRGRGAEEGKETVLCAKQFAARLITGTEWVESSKKWQKSMLCKAMKKCQKVNKYWV